MSRHPLTSSERRGILLVAILSLLITGAGLCVSYCDRRQTVTSPEEPEILYAPGSRSGVSNGLDRANDSAGGGKARGDSARDDLAGGRKSKRVKKQRKDYKKQRKVYRQRSPIDEPV